MSDAHRNQPCVWMEAGLVAFKLCDRRFDCDSCPFDAAMRGSFAEPTDAAPLTSLTDATVRDDWPDDRRYAHGHVWIRRIDDDRVRIGLDRFGADVLRGAGGVVLPAPGASVTRGAFVCWISVADTLMPVRAPVGGTVVSRNRALYEDPCDLSASPYDDGWLLEIRTDEPLDDFGEGPDDARARALRERAELEHKVAARIASSCSSTAGPTMPDGGLPARSPREVLGLPAYLALVSKFMTG